MFQWSEWMAWGGCTNSCGTGTKNRKRNCVTNDGRHVKYNQCRGESFEMVDCHTGNCPGEAPLTDCAKRLNGSGGFVFNVGLSVERVGCLVDLYEDVWRRVDQTATILHVRKLVSGRKEEKKACNTNKCDRDQMKHICKDKYPFCNQWK